MKHSIIFVAISALLAACSNAGPSEAPGALDVTSSAESLRGTYTSGESTLKFSSTEVEPKVFDIVVDIHGMTLSALVDQSKQVAEVDGFATNGGDTQLV